MTTSPGKARADDAFINAAVVMMMIVVVVRKMEIVGDDELLSPHDLTQVCAMNTLCLSMTQAV